jgi:DNA-binding HxlR family transcriptional regulator
MITPRDTDVINYLKEKGEADFMELHTKFFSEVSQQYTRKRLKQLTERGHIKRKKGVDDRYYIYYLEG